MKKIIWILVALIMGGYFFISNVEDKARLKAELAEAKRIERAEARQITKAALSQMISRTHAIDDWALQLSKGENYRLEPILTMELERLWLKNRPILFIGAIKDIATHDQSQYIVLLERSFVSSYEHIFVGTGFQLSLLISKERMDSFLKKHTDLFNDFGFDNVVAVVAHINAIRSRHVPGEEGERVVKIGDGELLEIMYIGDLTY